MATPCRFKASAYLGQRGFDGDCERCVEDAGPVLDAVGCGPELDGDGGIGFGEEAGTQGDVVGGVLRAADEGL